MRRLSKFSSYPSLINNLYSYGFLVVVLGVCLSGCQLSNSQASNELSSPPSQTVGWIEKTRISGLDSDTEAKLDTGATKTSINAEILEKPEDTSESGGMIRFRFSDKDGASKVYELPIVEWVRIKDGDGGFFRRPVVTMQICIAGRWIEGKVNLADRKQFDYSVLIGRNMLKKGALIIDSAETNTTPSNCPEQEQA